MEEMKNNIASKLVFYRKQSKLTQFEVAEKLNYSDKAVSKWERGESTPDIAVLKQLADLYSIELNDLLTDTTPEKPTHTFALTKFLKQKHILISLMSVFLVWLVACLIFVTLRIFFENVTRAYLVFIYAIPVSFLVSFILSEIWGGTVLRATLLSLFVWTTALAIFLTATSHTNIGLLFLIPIPMQLLILTWFIFKKQIIKFYKNVMPAKLKSDKHKKDK